MHPKDLWQQWNLKSWCVFWNLLQFWREAFWHKYFIVGLTFPPYFHVCTVACANFFFISALSIQGRMQRPYINFIKKNKNTKCQLQRSKNCKMLGRIENPIYGCNHTSYLSFLLHLPWHIWGMDATLAHLKNQQNTIQLCNTWWHLAAI